MKQAINYLSLTNNDVSNAVNLYLDSVENNEVNVVLPQNEQKILSQIQNTINDNRCAKQFCCHLQKIPEKIQIDQLKCQYCDLTEGIWMCGTCGLFLCGRRQYDGTGGNGHAMQHNQETQHSVYYKITSEDQSTGQFYCYLCNFNTLYYQKCDSICFNDQNLKDDFNGITVMIDKVIFSNFSNLQSIILTERLSCFGSTQQYCPILVSQYQEQTNQMDLSLFINLKVLKLQFPVRCDIMLPLYLDELQLCQETKYQHRILNDTVRAGSVDITDFDINNLVIYGKMKLQRCNVSKIIVAPSCIDQYDHISQLYKNQCQNIIIYKQDPNKVYQHQDGIYIKQNNYLPTIFCFKIDSIYKKINLIINE